MGKKILLIIYVVIIVTIICGEVALIAYTTAKSLMGEELIFTDDLWDKIDSESKKAIEKRFECCGYHNSTEYTEIPSSCYKSNSSSTDSPTIFQQGCYDALINWLENNIYTVVAIAALVLVLEVCQIIVATLIIRHFNKVKSNPTILTPSSQELKSRSPPIRQSHIYSSEQSQLHNRSPDHLRSHSPISPGHYNRSPDDHYFPSHSPHYDPHLHDYRHPMNYRRPSYSHRNYTNSAYRDER